MRITEEELRRLQAAATGARAEAWRWEEVARQLHAISEQVRPLLADVVEGWTPDVLDGQAASRGWHALLDQRAQLQLAVEELEDDADQARRRAAMA